jgi:hypothetical protein
MGGEKNCLFAEGITRESDKLVIKNSVVDGPEPFGLGSYFRDAAWYFISDTFSKQLREEGQIHREPAKNYELKWGEGRVYFANSKAPAYAWLEENLADSPAKIAATVTAKWVFPQWDPERTSGPTIKAVSKLAKSVELLFGEDVTVEGKPVIVLASGQRAIYLRGSGSNRLEFQTNGKSQANRLELNGGAIFSSSASLHRRDAALQSPSEHN